MMHAIEGLSDNVVGVRAEGEVTAEDYSKVLFPAIEAALSRHARVRLLYAVDSFEGFTPKAIWDDLKAGLKHWDHFDKIAFVSDHKQLAGAIKLMAFAIPCPIRVFPASDLTGAKAWIESSSDVTSLEHNLAADGRVLVLKPRGRLTRQDFKAVSEELEPVLRERGSLEGILIEAKHFPGWQNLAGFLSHMKFIAEHQRRVPRIALVTDDRMLASLPKTLGSVIKTEVRTFKYGEETAALTWLTEPSPAINSSMQQ